MSVLTQNEKKILAIAFAKSKSQETLSIEDVRKFYRSPHHGKAVIEYLHSNGFLACYNVGQFIITDEGKRALGIVINQKLTDFQELK